MKLTLEEKYLQSAILAARKIQTFLWGIADGAWGIEEWRRMFVKRYNKIGRIDKDNPHAIIELRKRLLQNAALSIALLAIIHKKDKIKVDSDIPSNLPDYKKYEGVYNEKENSKKMVEKE